MLTAIGALLLLLRRRVSRAQPSPQPSGAEQLRRLLANAYLIGRYEAARSGFESVRRELALFEPGLTLVEPQVDIFAASALANRAARGYAQRWLRDARAALADEIANPAAAATAKQAWRLELGATTEGARAFSEGRREAMRRFTADFPEVAAGYVRVWDSTLDKRTCPVCEGQDGSWILADEMWPNGDPGDVHNRCRCTDHVEPIGWQEAFNRAA